MAFLGLPLTLPIFVCFDYEKPKKTIMENKSNTTTFIMFKIINNKKVDEFKIEAISEHHAITVAEQFYKKNGLIGRYYCETENGNFFQINY